MQNAIEIRHYRNRAGKDVFDDWLTRLAGLWELRIDWGPGYRVYYATLGGVCVLLLCGGDKRTQSGDIDRARKYLEDYKERNRPRET